MTARQQLIKVLIPFFVDRLFILWAEDHAKIRFSDLSANEIVEEQSKKNVHTYEYYLSIDDKQYNRLLNEVYKAANIQLEIKKDRYVYKTTCQDR